MDQEKTYAVIGNLYVRSCLLDDEVKKLRLALQAKNEEVENLKERLGNESGTTSRISNK